MKIISRPRNSGKTTILLHYMEVNFGAIYVARTESCARSVAKLAEALGLHIDKSRFIGMTDPKINDVGFRAAHKLLVDDADHILARHGNAGYELIHHAEIITVNELD